MASNPYVNKVQTADGSVIMDISSDTVTPSDVLNGVTFHDRSGAAQQGSVITHNVYDGLDSTSTSDALSANQGKALNDKIGNITFAYSLGNTTLALIESGLVTLGNSMSDDETRSIKFRVNPASGIFSGTTYLGTIIRRTTGTYIVNVHGIQDPKQVVDGVYANGAWSWNSVNNQISSLYTQYSNNWVSSLSLNLPKQGAYLFVSQRYAQLAILIRFQNGNTTAAIVSGNNWTFANGTNGNITATATNTADYYIIPLIPVV